MCVIKTSNFLLIATLVWFIVEINYFTFHFLWRFWQQDGHLKEIVKEPYIIKELILKQLYILWKLNL